VSTEAVDDHPLSPAGMIRRVLEDQGIGVAVIDRPGSDDDLGRYGRPALFFGVTAGSIDSMLNNYTPLKRERFPKGDMRRMPDRALIRVCNDLRRLFKGCAIVIGGVEASLRRFAHYDYWDNDVRRSILLDCRADLLVFGNGEKQVVEAAHRTAGGGELIGIEGTCIRSDRPPGCVDLPAFEVVRRDPEAFCRMQNLFDNGSLLYQDGVVQFPYPRYTGKDLDRYHSLPFTRELAPGSSLGLARFSVVTHRGCIGRCSFCSIALHQGARIISRSEGSILEEIKRMTGHPLWKGYVDDLGGPSANMYGMDCEADCGNACTACGSLTRDHSRLIGLMKKAREVPGVKKVFVRSGVRYDLALESEEYLGELVEHHISGTLKVAPEHFDEEVLELMNKKGGRFREFVDAFVRTNADRKQSLRYYLMVGHPGDDVVKVKAMSRRAALMGNVEQFQLFTPTPMSVSTCMYWTGLDPRTMLPVKVVRDYRTKKVLKTMMMEAVGRSHGRR